MSDVEDIGEKTKVNRPKMRGIDAQSLPEKIAERIVEGIAAGRFFPGERLVEADIAAELQVSRMPVRAAFKALEKQGILVNVPHRGCRVMTLTDRKVRQIFQVRTDLELRACKDAMDRIAEDPAMIGEIDEILTQMKRSVVAKDTSGVVNADFAFHRWICARSDNEIVFTLWTALAHHVRIIFGLVGHDWPDLQKVFDEHLSLRNLLASGDQIALMRAMSNHLLEGIEPEAFRLLQSIQKTDRKSVV